jgi:hypothetical protein
MVRALSSFSKDSGFDLNRRHYVINKKVMKYLQTWEDLTVTDTNIEMRCISNIPEIWNDAKHKLKSSGNYSSSGKLFDRAAGRTKAYTVVWRSNIATWVRIPLGEWMYVCVISASVFCIGRGPTKDRSNVPGVLPDVYSGLLQDHTELHHRWYSSYSQLKEPRIQHTDFEIRKRKALGRVVLWCHTWRLK